MVRFVRRALVAAAACGLFALGHTAVHGQAPAPGAIVGTGTFTSFVENMDRSLAFYHDVFGMEVPAMPESGERPYNRSNPQLFAMFDIPDARERHQSARVPGTRLSVEVMEVQNVPHQTHQLRIQDPGNATLVLVVRDIDAALKGKTPIVQRNWMKALRPLMAFAIARGERKTDPTLGIKAARPPKSDGYLTWGEVQIEQYCARHEIGTMARLALELGLNIAARRHDARLIGRQHLKNGCLSWRPSKTSQTTAKVLTIRVLPELQAALDAMPRTDALTFLLTEHGRPFKSAPAFGNRFAAWCDAAGLKPVLCDDGKVRSYRFHGLRKAACTRMAHRGCSAPEIMSVSGHATLAEAQKYITAVEQEHMAAAAMTKVAAGSKRAQ
jgi:integrase